MDHDSFGLRLGDHPIKSALRPLSLTGTLATSLQAPNAHTRQQGSVGRRQGSRLGAQSGVGAPITVEGHLRGAVMAASTQALQLPAGSAVSDALLAANVS
jgi:hypothetical protein